MNILYINSHPQAKGSFHEAIEKAFVDHISPEHEVKVLRLGDASFDPILRHGYAKRMKPDSYIEESQELVRWADHIVFAFPVWWGDAPALMKGWIDRVFTPRVTYHVEGIKIHKLLRGTSADIIVTQRGLRPLAWVFGNHHIGIFTHNLFALCGIKKRRIITIGGIGLTSQFDTPKRRAHFLERVARAASSL